MLIDLFYFGVLGICVLMLLWFCTMPPLVQFSGAVFGIAGAALLATANPPAAGFAAFLASNICWMVFSVRGRLWGLFTQQIAFLITSVVGLWNWWLGPLVLG